MLLSGGRGARGWFPGVEARRFNLIMDRNMNVMLKRIAMFVMALAMVAGVARAQKIFSADRAYNADIKVFVTDREYKADLVVYRTDRRYRADAAENKGIWFFTDRRYDADKSIFFTDREYDADLIVYFTDREYRAGWKNAAKKYLLY